MKIELASCYFMNNYGSLLQAYALQRFLEDQGNSVENINIDGIKTDLDKLKIRYYLREAKDFSVILNKAGKVKKSVLKRVDRKYAETLSKRAAKVKIFREKYIKVSPLLPTKKEMGEYVSNAGAVIVGSDQLWLPSNIVADYYTLNFVPEQTRKISFSTSFGVSTLPNDYKEQTKKFLSRFDYLSVREDTGKKIINDLGLACELVCDPTLLLTQEEWLDAIPDHQRIEEPYIFCYFLGNIPEHRELAKKIRSETGMKIVALLHCEQYSKCDYGYADITPYDVGPDDFVNLIRHAALVLTDSFHGTCFSVIHNKQFFSLPRHRDDEKLSTNSRLYSLAQVLGFKDRIIPLKKIGDININSKIDYKDINEKLETFRRDSRDFLINAIK